MKYFAKESSGELKGIYHRLRWVCPRLELIFCHWIPKRWMSITEREMTLRCIDRVQGFIMNVGMQWQKTYNCLLHNFKCTAALIISQNNQACTDYNRYLFKDVFFFNSLLLTMLTVQTITNHSGKFQYEMTSWAWNRSRECITQTCYLERKMRLLFISRVHKNNHKIITFCSLSFSLALSLFSLWHFLEKRLSGRRIDGMHYNEPSLTPAHPSSSLGKL